jgi:small conductance mechanosensitive channel
MAMLDTMTEALGTLPWKEVLYKAVYVLIVLVLTQLLLRLVKSALVRFEEFLVAKTADDDRPVENQKRAETLTRLLRQAAVVVIWVICLFTILSEVGLDMGPILASAGIVGLAVGFGAQNLVRDMISGFFIILEDQVRVGDVAVVNGTGGLVEEIRLRTIVLRDLAGTVHVFPNGTINTLANMTKGWSAYVFEIGVAYKEDTDRVVELMKQAGAELRADEAFGAKIIDDLEVFGVDALADSSVVIKARFKTRPIAQWEIGREYLRRIKKLFDAEGIEIPFPHRSLHFGDRDIASRLLDRRA